MNFADFITKYNNKGIDFDGKFGFQCQDLYRQYVKEVLNLPQSPAVVGAKDNWDVYLTAHYTRYTNSPTAVPKNGDIVIWGTKFGEFGHVAIFIDGGITKFNSFDQNSPVGSLCHIQSHTYTGVLGWLRAKEITVTDGFPKWLATLLQERGLKIEDESEIRIIFDKAKKYDVEINELQEQVKSVNEALSDRSIEVSTLLGKLQKSNIRLEELEMLYGKTKNEKDGIVWENDKYKIQVDELQKGIDSREKEIEGLKEGLVKAQTNNIGGIGLFRFLYIKYFVKK